MMSFTIGIICAIIAMFAWGFGDFLIQKESRKIGDWEALFFISLFGAIILTPFVWHEVIDLFANPDYRLVFLSFASLVLLAAALLEFESLKEGKLAVIEPLFALEIPVSGFLAFALLSERIELPQVILIALLLLGLILVSFKKNKIQAKDWLERGVLIAIAGTILMGAVNFLFGIGARETSALMINWFTSVFLVVICFIYLAKKNKMRDIVTQIKSGSKPLWGMMIFDNIAWIAFAYAMLNAPISIAVALSQSYILITVGLGIVVNKEKLSSHQKFGLFLSVVMAIILSTTL